jgi:hypothetical protein
VVPASSSVVLVDVCLGLLAGSVIAIAFMVALRDNGNPSRH